MYRPKVALLNVSPPDKHGFCSLGVEVCAARAAWECADLRIAQINPQMPRTHGTSFVPYNSFDYVCHTPSHQQALPQSSLPMMGKEDALIGQHIAALIPNGATLQVGIGVCCPPLSLVLSIRSWADA